MSAQVPAGAGAGTPLQREAVRTIYERGEPGRRAFVAPALDVPEADAETLLPAHLRRREPARLPEVSEPELVRHYVRLSKRNFDLDSGFYPLGSCTMKHNPRLHERVAALPGHARLHPLQDPEHAQGALELMWRLERALGGDRGPAARLAAARGGRARRARRGAAHARLPRRPRRAATQGPDARHGARHEPGDGDDGGLRARQGGQRRRRRRRPRGPPGQGDRRGRLPDARPTPTRSGIFDPNIEEIAEIVHDAGATLYYDGANLNAIMGLTRPGDMGFDIVHFNLHKSFTQPHGGGGPGIGPIAVSDRIEPYLMVPRIVRHEPRRRRRASTSSDDAPKSIGRLRGFQGNYGCFVRAYAYICSLGADGLRDASEIAVLNANYLLARLRALGVADRLPLAFGERCMHEFVLPARR